MLTRVYIDNFRCFVNFEWRPGKKQLILGENGSGKSSLLDALLRVRQAAVQGGFIEDLYGAEQLTRWMHQPIQTFEIEAQLKHRRYLYRLVIEPDRSTEPRPRIVWESVQLDGKAIFEFAAGEVRLFNDNFEHQVTYPISAYRSSLATITSRPDNQKLTEFKLWLGEIQFFRINPFAIEPRARGERYQPNLDLSNFAEWYRYLLQNYPKENAAFLDNLRSVLDKFTFFHLETIGRDVHALLAAFGDDGGEASKFGFNELSDGQRCVICLYAIVHFVLSKGRTVIIDEPDNFVSLRELQPWLMAVTDAVDDEAGGQAILVSHHPELMNQWATEFGVQFVREGGIGPVRAREFNGETGSGLSPAELVARGWALG